MTDDDATEPLIFDASELNGMRLVPTRMLIEGQEILLPGHPDYDPATEETSPIHVTFRDGGFNVDFRDNIEIPNNGTLHMEWRDPE